MSQIIEQTKKLGKEWEEIEWDHHRNHVRRIQERIFRETRKKNWKKVKNLQKLLVRSHSVRLIAVKQVTQENKGKYTAGIDGKIYYTPTSRMKLVREIKTHNPHNYKCQPVKRGIYLMFMASIVVNSKRYTKVKGYNSPYDPDLHQYWQKRT